MSTCNVKPFADESLSLANRANEIDLKLIHAKPADRPALEAELAAIDLKLPRLDAEAAKRYANCQKSAVFQISIVRRALETLRHSELSEAQRLEQFDHAERCLKSLQQFVANLKDPSKTSKRRRRAGAS